MPQQETAIQQERRLCFRINAQEFGLRLQNINEIVNVPAITKVFHVPDYTVGLINLRGNVIAVIDPGIMLGIGKIAVTKNARVIIVQNQACAAGILVSSVTGIRTIDMANVQQVSAAVLGVSRDCLSGIVQLPERPLVLLNLDLMLAETSFAEEMR